MFQCHGLTLSLKIALSWFRRSRLGTRPMKRGGTANALTSPQTSFESLELRTLPAITFTVSFDDPSASQAAYYSGLEQNLLAAGAQWSQHLAGTATIDVVIRFSNVVPRATGGSETVVFVREEDGINVYQEGAASEILTGVDPNGTAPDLAITIGVNYLTNELWLDPTPESDADPIPGNRTDAVSVLAHELGHGFGFIGYGDSSTGSLSGQFATLYDQLVTFDGRDLYFHGPQAMEVYGGPVPLTFGNHFHLANRAPRPGSDLLEDLMNGVAFQRGVRYRPSILDLAILADNNVPLLTDPGVNHAPVVEPQALNIVELSTNGTLVTTVIVNDVDFGQSVSFEIISGNETGAFLIDSTTGVISVADGARLEFEEQSEFTLIVQATDNGLPALSGTAAVTIHLTERAIPQIVTSSGTTTRGRSAKTIVDAAIAFQTDESFLDPLGSRLQIAIASGIRSKDQLLVNAPGPRSTKLQLKNGLLKRGKTIIATAGPNNSSSNLELVFLSTATNQDVERVLRNVTLQSSRRETGQRTISFQFHPNETESSEIATKSVLIP